MYGRDLTAAWYTLVDIHQINDTMTLLVDGTSEDNLETMPRIEVVSIGYLTRENCVEMKCHLQSTRRCKEDSQVHAYRNKGAPILSSKKFAI